MDTKQDIRKKLQTLRDSLPEEERQRYSCLIQQKLMKLPEYQEADLIFSYAAFRSEVVTDAIALHTIEHGKTLCYPCIGTETGGIKQMAFYQTLGLQELMPGTWGIQEPKADIHQRINPLEWKSQKCFMMVPGCGFDREGSRIGYGRGYYDRYLEQYPFLTTAGICFTIQLVQKLITEPSDIKMQKIITESETLYFP